jgi:hypothetical protein
LGEGGKAVVMLGLLVQVAHLIARRVMRHASSVVGGPSSVVRLTHAGELHR